MRNVTTLVDDASMRVTVSWLDPADNDTVAALQYYIVEWGNETVFFLNTIQLEEGRLNVSHVSHMTCSCPFQYPCDYYT